MPLEGTCLIVGLGNPGSRYEKTRHNIGFMVADDVSLTFGIPLDKKKYDCRFGRGTIKDRDIMLAKPMTYMNSSGPPVQKLMHFYKIPASHMLVIHDDIDLAYGRIKIMEKGGHGGHNGIRSITEALGDGDFPRLRVGVGRPAMKKDIIDHVLGRFASEEEAILEKIITKTRECVIFLLTNGIKEGMNQFNNRKLLIAK